MAWEEPFAMGLALGYLLLIILEQRSAWLLAALSAGLYLKIFYDVGLFMEAGLQVFYIVMAVYGFWAWGCLLYTSPSPRDKRQSRMPSSA